MHKPPTETVTYILQQPIDNQVVCIDQPDVSVPPPLPGERVGEADQPAVSHQTVQPVAVNEYGQPLEVVEIIQQRPHHLPPPVALQHSECHVTGVPPPGISNSVPRYPGVAPGSTENAGVIPSLLDVDLQSSSRHVQARRPLSSLPPIEVSITKLSYMTICL